jgi:hypothetical protein
MESGALILTSLVGAVDRPDGALLYADYEVGGGPRSSR